MRASSRSRGGALGEAHDGDPQRAVADERRDVDGAAGRARTALEVLAEGAPVPGHGVRAPGVVLPVRHGVVAVAPRVSGAADMPQLPVTCVVTPWRTADSARGMLQDGEVGVGVRVDEAGRDVAAGDVDDAPPRSVPGAPIAAIRSPRTATSPRYQGLPQPSTTRPPAIDEVVDGAVHASPISKTWYGFSQGGPAQA